MISVSRNADGDFFAQKTGFLLISTAYRTGSRKSFYLNREKRRVHVCFLSEGVIEMTEEEKKRILKLHKDGWGYKRIAEEMGISVNTVKSFCRRAQQIQLDNANAGVCRYCGKPLVYTPGKKKKQFCDDRCRSKYWVEHRNELAQKVTYTFKCAHCGKEFTIYGKRNRKYCSKECYFADRFDE